MKKVILTLVLAITSMVSFSQSQPVIVETYANRVGMWNEYNKDYDYEEWVESNLTFTIYKDYITVNDRGHSIYRIVEDQPINNTEHCKINSADCLDENNVKCTVALARCKDKSASLNVMYGNKVFVYMIKQ